MEKKTKSIAIKIFLIFFLLFIGIKIWNTYNNNDDYFERKFLHFIKGWVLLLIICFFYTFFFKN